MSEGEKSKKGHHPARHSFLIMDEQPQQPEQTVGTVVALALEKLRTFLEGEELRKWLIPVPSVLERGEKERLGVEFAIEFTDNCLMRHKKLFQLLDTYLIFVEEEEHQWRAVVSLLYTKIGLMSFVAEANFYKAPLKHIRQLVSFTMLFIACVDEIHGTPDEEDVIEPSEDNKNREQAILHMLDFADFSSITGFLLREATNSLFATSSTPTEHDAKDTAQ